MHTEMFKVKNKELISFLIYELNNGHFYGRITTAPNKVKSNFPIMEAKAEEFITEEKNTRAEVLKIILEKLKISEKEIELIRKV